MDPTEQQLFSERVSEFDQTIANPIASHSHQRTLKRSLEMGRKSFCYLNPFGHVLYFSPGAQHQPVWLDPEPPDGQTPGCVDRHHHILHPDSQHQHSYGLRAQPSPVLTVHVQLRDYPQLQHDHQVVDDMTVIGLITGNNETAYREEVRALTSWCQGNNLQLNVRTTTSSPYIEYRTTGRNKEKDTSSLP